MGGAAMGASLAASRVTERRNRRRDTPRKAERQASDSAPPCAGRVQGLRSVGASYAGRLQVLADKGRSGLRGQTGHLVLQSRGRTCGTESTSSTGVHGACEKRQGR